MSRARTRRKKEKKKPIRIVHKDTKIAKIKHHTNPRLSLKLFSDNNTIMKMDSRRIPEKFGIGGASVNKYFYTFFGRDDPDILENLMAEEIESPAASVMEYISKNGKFPKTENDLELFCLFLALQFLRSPAKRKLDFNATRIEFEKSHIAPMILKHMTVDTFNKIANAVHMETWLKQLFDVSNYISSMRKILFTFDKESLATSASPIMVVFNKLDNKGNLKQENREFNPYEENALAFSRSGDINECTAIFYPLSRKKGLILMSDSLFTDDLSIIKDSSDVANAFNYLLGCDTKQLFFHPDDTKYFKDFYFCSSARSNPQLIQEILIKLSTNTNTL